MKTIGCLMMACLMVGIGSAQEVAPKKRAPHPSVVKVVDVEGLPRVLLIGDSISMGYTLAVRELLEGKANVHRIPMNGGPTSRGVENIDQWLGEGNWDVIHFNWGIHDLKVMPSGERQVEPGPYEANLRALVAKMKATGATLIWASTTPIVHEELPAEGSKFGDVEEYNKIAAKVMKENGVATNDLYGYVLPELKRVQRPNNLHFLTEGSEFLAVKVAGEIEKVLKDLK